MEFVFAFTHINPHAALALFRPAQNVTFQQEDVPVRTSREYSNYNNSVNLTLLQINNKVDSLCLRAHDPVKSWETHEKKVVEQLKIWIQFFFFYSVQKHFSQLQSFWFISPIRTTPVNPLRSHPSPSLLSHRSQKHVCCFQRLCGSGGAVLGRVRGHPVPHLLPVHQPTAADGGPDPLVAGALPEPRAASSGPGRLPAVFGGRPGDQRSVWCLWLW